METKTTNNNFENFVDAFSELCINYAEHVSERVQVSNQIVTTMSTHLESPKIAAQLVEEVRTANVLAVTLGRLEALKTGQQFGINAGI